MADIFICYSRTNADVAELFYSRFQAEGWSVWMDTHIQSGHAYRDVIDEQLAAARCVVVLWSLAATKSHFVMDEAEDARSRGILFPALIENVRPPIGYRQLQCSDLVDWEGQDYHPGMEELLVTLHHQLDQSNPIHQTAVDGTEGSIHPYRSTQARTFRDKLTSGGDGPLMVVVPPGSFLMGSPDRELGRRPDESPQHEVRISQPFSIGVYQVTFDEYDRFCDATLSTRPADNGWGRENRPVINQSWHQVQAYCRWLSQQTKRLYRLPSEAEWEYACRAGTSTAFHVGATMDTSQANIDGRFPYGNSSLGEYRGGTIPVGSFPSNAFGIHDMHGNVFEWCLDIWRPGYVGAPRDGSATGGTDSTRVVRGGSWGHEARFARSGARDREAPGTSNAGLGFRVVCGSPTALGSL